MDEGISMVTCHDDRNVICLDGFTYEQWRMVGIKENLPNNAEIGKFLIQIYYTSRRHVQLSPHCTHCGCPITAVCHTCQTGSSQPHTELKHQSTTQGNKDPTSEETSKGPGCRRKHLKSRKQQAQRHQQETQTTGQSSIGGLSDTAPSSVSASCISSKNGCETEKAEEKDPESGSWTYKEISALRQYITDRERERKTRLFWQTCADILSAQFGVKRTATAYKLQYSQQQRLASDLHTQSTISGTEVVVGANSKMLAHVMLKSDMAKRNLAADKTDAVQEDSYIEDEDITEGESYLEEEKYTRSQWKGTGRKKIWELSPTCGEMIKNSCSVVETSQDSNSQSLEFPQETEDKMSKTSKFSSALIVKSSSDSVETLNTVSPDLATKFASHKDCIKTSHKLDTKLKPSRENFEDAAEICSLEDDVEKCQNPVDYELSKSESLPSQTEGTEKNESQIPSDNNSNEDRSKVLLSISGLGVSQPRSSEGIEETQISKDCNTGESQIFFPQTQTSTSDNSSINHALDTSTSEPTWIYIGVADLDVQLLAKDHSDIYCQQQQRKRIHDLSSHQQRRRRCSSINIYKCKECGKAFQKREGLINHIRWVHCAWRPFRCSLCPAAFRSRSRLQRHICVAHTKVRPYRCETCNASFVDRCALNTHALTHQADRPYRYFCEYCGKGYHGLKGLKRHLVSHSGVKPGPPMKTVLCWVCGKAVASTTYLKLHLKTHSPESAITCAICCQTFVSKWALDKHLNSIVHQKRLDKKNTPAVDKEDMKDNRVEQSDKGYTSTGNKIQNRTGAFKCDMCEKSFSSKKSASRHRRCVHLLKYKSDNVESDQDLQHQSNDRELAVSSALIQNSTEKQEVGTRVSHVDRKYENQISGVQLSGKEQLTLIPNQKKSDTAPRKFRCDICLQSFSLQQNLRRHKRNVHLGGRDFRCDLCEKSFKENYCLKQHKNIFHNPAGQVSRQTVNCDICDKAFLTKSAMTMHKRTVHYGLKKESCLFCFKGFRDKFTLERHQKSCQRRTAARSNTEEFIHTSQTQKNQTQFVKTQEAALSVLGSVSVPSNSSTASCFTSLNSGCLWNNLVPTFEPTDQDSDASHSVRNIAQFVPSVESGTATGTLETVDLWNLG